jgi:hypothetical protein
MSENSQNSEQAATENDKNEPWKLLDEAVRKWVVMSQWENDQSYYQKLKEQYQ